MFRAAKEDPSLGVAYFERESRRFIDGDSGTLVRFLVRNFAATTSEAAEQFEVSGLDPEDSFGEDDGDVGAAVSDRRAQVPKRDLDGDSPGGDSGGAGAGAAARDTTEGNRDSRRRTDNSDRKGASRRAREGSDRSLRRPSNQATSAQAPREHCTALVSELPRDYRRNDLDRLFRDGGVPGRVVFDGSEHALLEFRSQSERDAAIRACDKREILGRRVTVCALEERDRVFIGGIPKQAPERRVRDVIERSGGRTKRIVVMSGFAFATYDSGLAAHEAIRGLRTARIDGRSLTVLFARPKLQPARGESPAPPSSREPPRGSSSRERPRGSSRERPRGSSRERPRGSSRERPRVTLRDSPPPPSLPPRRARNPTPTDGPGSYKFVTVFFDALGEYARNAYHRMQAETDRAPTERLGRGRYRRRDSRDRSPEQVRRRTPPRDLPRRGNITLRARSRSRDRARRTTPPRDDRFDGRRMDRR